MRMTRLPVVVPCSNSTTWTPSLSVTSQVATRSPWNGIRVCGALTRGNSHRSPKQNGARRAGLTNAYKCGCKACGWCLVCEASGKLASAAGVLACAGAGQGEGEGQAEGQGRCGQVNAYQAARRVGHLAQTGGPGALVWWRPCLSAMAVYGPHPGAALSCQRYPPASLTSSLGRGSTTRGLFCCLHL